MGQRCAATEQVRCEPAGGSSRAFDRRLGGDRRGRRGRPLRRWWASDRGWSRGRGSGGAQETQCYSAREVPYRRIAGRGARAACENGGQSMGLNGWAAMVCDAMEGLGWAGWAGPAVECAGLGGAGRVGVRVGAWASVCVCVRVCVCALCSRGFPPTASRLRCTAHDSLGLWLWAFGFWHVFAFLRLQRLSAAVRRAGLHPCSVAPLSVAAGQKPADVVCLLIRFNASPPPALCPLTPPEPATALLSLPYQVLPVCARAAQPPSSLAGLANDGAVGQR